MASLTTKIAFLFAIGLATPCCDTPTEPNEPPDVPNVRQWVTGDAALALDSNGHFILPIPSGARIAEVLSPSEARVQALAFFHTFAFPDVSIGATFGQRIVAEHGQFDPRRVRLASPLYYAETPYATVPDTVPMHIKKYLGSRYVIYYALGDAILGALASSVHNTDFVVDGGRLRIGNGGGNAFRTAVVPRGHSYTYPISPERAVEVAARTLGAKTSGVPRLILPHRHFSAQFSRWELVLDRPLMLIGDSSGSMISTNTVYVGLSPTARSAAHFEAIAAAVREQPAYDTIVYTIPQTQDQVTVRVGVVRPVHLERVTQALPMSVVR